MDNGNGSNGNGAATLTPPAPTEQLLDRLNDPKVVESLNSILDNLELIAFSVTAADGFLRRADNVIDAVAEGVKDAKASIPELDSELIAPESIVPLLTQFAKLGVQLSEVMDSDEFAALMQSGVLSPETLTLVGQAGDALVESRQEAARQSSQQRIGIFGLLRALNDPDVQASLQFLLAFSKKFGHKVNNA